MAGATGETSDRTWALPAYGVGISYPLVISATAGVLLPLHGRDTDELYPASPSARLDAEAGLGGGSVSAGFYLPLGVPFVVNVKGARMRTWLGTWGVDRNRTFNGGIAELVVLGHLPAKAGVGFFRDTAPLNGVRKSFTYLFLGYGW